MIVQSTTPSDLPQRVRVDPLGTGRSIVADVVTTTLEADAGGPRDVLTVERDGSRYRVDAADAEAYPPHGGQA